MATKLTRKLANGQRVLPLYHWTPPRGYANFGDEISPLIVQAVLRWNGIEDVIVETTSDGAKLVAIGSVIQHVREGDVVWGAGINGKSWPRLLDKLSNVRFCSVRGPVTREAILSVGHTCPEIFGDPGLMFPALFETAIQKERKRLGSEIEGRTIFIPNLNDERLLSRQRYAPPPGVDLISPGLDPFEVAARISAAAMVIASSLHGIILAEAYGRSTRVVASYFEPVLKYVDYFEGTGRSLPRVHSTIVEAMDGSDHPPPDFDMQALLSAFPANAV